MIYRSENLFNLPYWHFPRRTAFAAHRSNRQSKHIRARSTCHIPRNLGTINATIEDGILLDY
jgi:hypothetical protein